MFVTTPALECSLPASLREPGGKYWAAFKLSTETPWFLITFASPTDEGWMAQTVGVSWESTLLSLLESVGPEDVVSIRRMGLTSHRPGAWGMREVVEIWRPAADEVNQVGGLLFRFADDIGLWDAFLKPVELTVPGRELVVGLHT